MVIYCIEYSLFNIVFLDWFSVPEIVSRGPPEVHIAMYSARLPFDDWKLNFLIDGSIKGLFLKLYENTFSKFSGKKQNIIWKKTLKQYAILILLQTNF